MGKYRVRIRPKVAEAIIEVEADSTWEAEHNALHAVSLQVDMKVVSTRPIRSAR